MKIRAAYVSYADYGGPLVHTREFVTAFRRFVPELVTYCPYLEKDVSPVYTASETCLNRMSAYFPASVRQLKLEFYQLRKLLRDLAKWKHFGMLYRENDVNLLIVRNDAYVAGPIFAAIRKGIPFVLETNGILSKDKPDRVSHAFENYVFSKAAGVVAVSEPLAELVAGCGVEKQKIRVVPNGVRIEAFASPDMSVIPEKIRDRLGQTMVIGYCGTFTENHEVSTVVSGMAQALSAVPNLQLLLIGKGREDQAIRGQVNKLQIQDNVIFAGKVPHDHIPAYSQLCDIMANPMQQVYDEGFVGVPIKMFEYMAAKRPIISTDMPNLRQLLDESAIFVSPASAEGWRDAIIRLATDEGLRRKKGEEAFARLKECRYTWEENARKIFEFCGEIVTESTLPE